VKILYVEDYAELRRSFSRYATRQGHEVMTRPDGDLAVELLEPGQRFDVVVLDHCMPGMHGAELVARIRELLPGVPVVALTGTPHEARGAGYDQVFTKPIDDEELLAGLRGLLNGGVHA
jgi:CheY-like chemotaxis protein